MPGSKRKSRKRVDTNVHRQRRRRTFQEEFGGGQGMPGELDQLPQEWRTVHQLGLDYPYKMGLGRDSVSAGCHMRKGGRSSHMCQLPCRVPSRLGRPAARNLADDARWVVHCQLQPSVQPSAGALARQRQGRIAESGIKADHCEHHVYRRIQLG